MSQDTTVLRGHLHCYVHKIIKGNLSSTWILGLILHRWHQHKAPLYPVWTPAKKKNRTATTKKKPQTPVLLSGLTGLLKL
jgi:hypothetical protein